MSIDIESYSTAPLISSDSATALFGITRFWRDLHALLNEKRPPELIIEDILRMIGLSFGADRAYTFSVNASRSFSSCTYEWVRRPEYELKPMLQNIDQSKLEGWLRRFDRSTSISIPDVDDPPDDLRQAAAKFKADRIRSIHVFGFYDEGRLIGYLGIDYIESARQLDAGTMDILYQIASTLNLFLLRHESLELWKQTARSMPAAMFIKDADNDLRYIYANPRYQQLYGRYIIGKTDIEIFGWEIGELFRAQDAQCLTSGVPFRIDESQCDYSDTAKGYYSTVKFPVITKTGRRFVAGFISDISYEHEMRLHAQELLEKSEVAEKSKSMFLSAMSHEIRTPLNTIIGLLDELRHTDIPESDRNSYIATATNASRALLALLNDVLDISKLESGKMHMTAAETDLTVILAECRSIFSDNCRRKGLLYDCEVSADLPVLIVDASRLRQILFNLISNAVKFTESGRVYVYGGFERKGSGTGTLTLEISDTGCGIPPEDQSHVFNLFAQASSIRGTSVANKGTGLGLYLCKQLAAQMNGDIRINSKVGDGTTFTVTFREMPFVEHAVSSDVVRHRKDQTVRISPISLTTRVLIVDDVAMNLKVLGIILKRLNIDFVPARSAKEALTILEQGGFSHVLTDIWMPEENGETLARKIRENPKWANIRLAAQTADVEASDNFDTSLFDAVLSKPLTPETVYAFLRK